MFAEKKAYCDECLSHGKTCVCFNPNGEIEEFRMEKFRVCEECLLAGLEAIRKGSPPLPSGKPERRVADARWSEWRVSK